MCDDFYYDSATETANSIVNEIASTYQISLSNVRWSYFVKFLVENYSVAIEPHTFSNPVLDTRFAGVVMLGKHPIIQYNNSVTQSEERQHFTVVHEGVHFFRHKDDPNAIGEHFADIVEHSAYSDDEKIEELITNQAASIIMLNDVALKKCMYNNWSFGKIAGFYGMSCPALFERLVNYLHFNLSIKENTAHYLVGRFRFGDTIEACEFLPILITNFDNFIELSNRTSLTGNDLDEFYKELGIGNTAPTSHWYQLQHIFPQNFNLIS